MFIGQIFKHFSWVVQEGQHACFLDSCLVFPSVRLDRKISLWHKGARGSFHKIKERTMEALHRTEICITSQPTWERWTISWASCATKLGTTLNTTTILCPMDAFDFRLYVTQPVCPPGAHQGHLWHHYGQLRDSATLNLSTQRAKTVPSLILWALTRGSDLAVLWRWIWIQNNPEKEKARFKLNRIEQNREKEDRTF